MLTQSPKPKTQNRDADPKADLRTRCLEFSLRVLRYVGGLPDSNVYRVLTGQLLRSSTSIGANMFEARGAGSKKDFIHCYEIALKSANETSYWLLLMSGLSTKERGEIDALVRETRELMKMIAASIVTMKGNL